MKTRYQALICMDVTNINKGQCKLKAIENKDFLVLELCRGVVYKRQESSTTGKGK